MSKGKKRCYFCKCALTNQNATQTMKSSRWNYHSGIWLDCCHACKSKEEKKP